MAIVRGALAEKKAKSFGILFGIRAAYEIGYQLIYAFCTESAGSVYDEGTALVVSLIFSLAVLAASIYAWKITMRNYPAGREPQNKQRGGKQKVAEDEQRKKSLAWQEVRNMNRPANIDKKEEAVVAAEGKTESEAEKSRMED